MIYRTYLPCFFPVFERAFVSIHLYIYYSISKRMWFTLTCIVTVKSSSSAKCRHTHTDFAIQHLILSYFAALRLPIWPKCCCAISQYLTQWNCTQCTNTDTDKRGIKKTITERKKERFFLRVFFSSFFSLVQEVFLKLVRSKCMNSHFHRHE